MLANGAPFRVRDLAMGLRDYENARPDRELSDAGRELVDAFVRHEKLWVKGTLETLGAHALGLALQVALSCTSAVLATWTLLYFLSEIYSWGVALSAATAIHGMLLGLAHALWRRSTGRRKG